MMNGVRIFCAVGLVVAVLGLTLPRTTADDGREFWNAPDPGFVLVDVLYRGGTSGVNSHYTVFADGRLIAERVGSKGKVFATQEHQIPAEALDELLQDITAAGIMEYNQEDVLNRMGPKRRAIVVSDGSTMYLKVALQRYRAPGQESANPAEVSLHFASPSLMAPHFPDVVELQGLSRIDSWFREYKIRPQRKQ